MNRLEKLNQYLRYWQRHLNLQKWDLSVNLVDFNRTDYNQSGDIKVDLKKKKAVVLINKDGTGRDKGVILHELVHLILWEFDHYCEASLPANKKDKYFNQLEKTVSELTNIFLQK